MKLKKFTYVCLLFLIFGQMFPNYTEAASNAKLSPALQQYLKKWNYPNIAFYYENLENGTSYYYNKNKGYYPCCTIKVKGIMNLYEGIRDGKYSDNAKMTFGAGDYHVGSGIVIHRSYNKQYTLAQLSEYAIRYSDNAAYIMTQKYMGRRLSYVTGSDERSISPSNAYGFLKRLYKFVQKKDKYSRDLLRYFKTTVYNNGIPAGIEKDYNVLHKGGDLPKLGVNHDIALIMNESPYILAIYTGPMGGYGRSNPFMAGLTRVIEQENRKIVTESDKKAAAKGKRLGIIKNGEISNIKAKRITEAEFVTALTKYISDEYKLKTKNYSTLVKKLGITDNAAPSDKIIITKEKAALYIDKAYGALNRISENNKISENETALKKMRVDKKKISDKNKKLKAGLKFARAEIKKLEKEQDTAADIISPNAIASEIKIEKLSKAKSKVADLNEIISENKAAIEKLNAEILIVKQNNKAIKEKIKDKNKKIDENYKAFKINEKIVDQSEFSKGYDKIAIKLLANDIIPASFDNFFRPKMKMNMVDAFKMMDKMMAALNKCYYRRKL